ncbi:MAG: NAD-glutamate dehydrogenase, partial [Actinomycetota bacterium]|nr:NAD-glutamate dehydrogenase [Actinomycetota bacterium]
LKLDSARVPELPPPRPFVDTFVYSPRVEGLHLRGGLIARGGIRWSNRQDDLRTEVLGLVRAQVLKNAGIVPTGAKGAFVCKRLGPDARRDPGDRPAVDVVAEVRECYRLFIAGLLAITDNVVAGRVVPPPGVVATDGEDSYFVVAADRGTATLSDLANQISAEHGFWLGDAFASGGSRGYDHKAMGITARGAWVVVQQHFRQLGIDVQHEPIRVVGVGDMSGDVFGNGMKRSRAIKLVAAFDHRDIFIDPSPDPERSFAARAQLAQLSTSSWQDYDRSALSAGGGIWSRTTKQVPLSPSAATVLGLPEGPVSPPVLMSAILTAPADLMFLGGIGTFVKGASESNAEVGDLANNTIRVDAGQVRARVVAEGGNLGFTQRARIAYSRRGGKINTDFIDNAAGVATSDYEVNLKILLAQAIEAGSLAAAERDQVLAEVADDVADAVLHDTALSAIAVTRAVPASAADIDAYEALMAALEQAGRLDRKVEVLPDAEEVVVRRTAGAGLTRPEAAVLLAYAKSELAHAVEQAPLATDPAVRVAVEAYFPDAVTRRFGDLMSRHRLYRQLVAARVANEIVDRMGVTWGHETADEFGIGLSELAAAYWIARQVLRADDWWREVETLAPRVPADTEEVLHSAVVGAVDTLARHYLSLPAADLDVRVSQDRPVAAELQAGGGSNRGPGADALLAAGVEPQLADAFGRLPAMAAAGDVAILT